MKYVLGAWSLGLHSAQGHLSLGWDPRHLQGSALTQKVALCLRKHTIH